MRACYVPQNVGVVFWFEELGPLNDAYATLLFCSLLNGVAFAAFLVIYIVRNRRRGARCTGKPMWFGWCVRWLT